MKMIFAVDENWNIGYDGDMLFKISKDLQRFRRLTETNIIIMGRKTFESLPDQKALPNRINIVITRDATYKADDIVVVTSIDELFQLLEKINPDNSMVNFVIGGGNIAHQLLQYCNYAYITKVLRSFDATDTLIPNLDEDQDWKILSQSPYYMQDDLMYNYVDYERIREA
ncbi:MAG: dihydrofolate reductase [Tissierellia bacterium]|jgi:dihydrofolate reductase|nr:dihydrofolate reductase [Tissierellia bacterium]